MRSSIGEDEKFQRPGLHWSNQGLQDSVVGKAFATKLDNLSSIIGTYCGKREATL